MIDIGIVFRRSGQKRCVGASCPILLRRRLWVRALVTDVYQWLAPCWLSPLYVCVYVLDVAVYDCGKSTRRSPFVTPTGIVKPPQVLGLPSGLGYTLFPVLCTSLVQVLHITSYILNLIHTGARTNARPCYPCEASSRARSVIPPSRYPASCSRTSPAHPAANSAISACLWGI